MMKILIFFLVLFTLAACATTDQKVAVGQIALTAVTVKQKGCLPIGSMLDPYVACVNTDTDQKVNMCLLSALVAVNAPIPIPICAGGAPNPAPTPTVPPVAVPPTAPAAPAASGPPSSPPNSSAAGAVPPKAKP